MQSAPPSPPPIAPLRRAFWVLAGMSFCLIVLGALVRAHGAGLACPDWPRCFGRWLPPMDLKVAFEWSHRLLAGSVALGFFLVSGLVLRHAPLRRVLQTTLGLAALLLALQIVLGGLTVLRLLAAWTVTSHLVTGNLFAATLLLAAQQLRELERPPLFSTSLTPEKWGALLLSAALLVGQMILGGLVSSQYAGLACSEWPRCSGGLWFPSWEGSVGLHLAHRLNGYALVGSLVAAAWVTRSTAYLGKRTALAALLGLCQVGVGIANVLGGLPVEITALHSAFASALVLTTALSLREAWRARTIAKPGVPTQNKTPSAFL